MSENSLSKTETVFLFGAGASVDAEIPDTYNFVKFFEDHVKQYHNDFSQLLSKIVKVREKFNERILGIEKKKVDIEQLLDTIRRLIQRNNDPLLEFYDVKSFSLDIEEDNFAKLKELLENFIREKVIVEDESKLDYLKELLKFDKPIEIFSTNYDTCIEQLSHIHHMRYTDGFDVYWNPKNFKYNFDVKHYKMHGSVIWYQSLKTKECVKIPVHAFLKGEPIELKLIYGEEVAPLVIYPAQKAEYVEPLTDLQLRFKNRLINSETKFLVVVGYSFRDDYIIHMLWDAARVNKNLHVLLISPSAQEIFENKLKFINKEKNATSRIDGRVLCLPYPFSTVINKLRNQYLDTLTQILSEYQAYLDVESSGRGEPSWKNLVRLCIYAEFLTKSEDALQKTKKDWQDLQFGIHSELLLLGFKALLHSVICKDGNEERWLKRFNDTFKIFNVDDLFIKDRGLTKAIFGIEVNGKKETIENFLKNWLEPLINEKRQKIELLSPKYQNSLDKIQPSLDKLDEFYERLSNLGKGISWGEYKELESDTPEIKSFIRKFDAAVQRGSWKSPEPNSLILGVEKGRLRLFLGAEGFEFKIT